MARQSSVVVKGINHGIRKTWVQFSAVPLNVCPWTILLNLSRSQFLHWNPVIIKVPLHGVGEGIQWDYACKKHLSLSPVHSKCSRNVGYLLGCLLPHYFNIHRLKKKKKKGFIAIHRLSKLQEILRVIPTKMFSWNGCPTTSPEHLPLMRSLPLPEVHPLLQSLGSFDG